MGSPESTAVVPPRRPLLTALLLVLAGCSGTPVADSPTTDTIATPAPVPTDDLHDDELAPGLTQEGIVDAERLARAHQQFLSNHSFRRAGGTRYRFENGTLLFHTTYNRTVDRAADRQLLEFGQVGPWRQNERYAEWANESLVVERIARNDTVRYERRPRTDRTLGYLGGGVAEFVAEREPRVVGQRTRNGTTEYVLVAAAESGPRLLEQIGANRTSTPRLVAVVTRQGVVRSVELTVSGTYEGAPIRVRNYYVLSGLGEATVTRPPWLDTALNATRETPTRTAG